MHKQSTERNTFTGIYNQLGAMQGHKYEVLDVLVDPPHHTSLQRMSHHTWSWADPLRATGMLLHNE